MKLPRTLKWVLGWRKLVGLGETNPFISLSVTLGSKADMCAHIHMLTLYFNIPLETWTPNILLKTSKYYAVSEVAKKNFSASLHTSLPWNESEELNKSPGFISVFAFCLDHFLLFGLIAASIMWWQIKQISFMFCCERVLFPVKSKMNRM